MKNERQQFVVKFKTGKRRIFPVVDGGVSRDKREKSTTNLWYIKYHNHV